jgi:ribA/ribD-fused uncharacterized protein
MVRSDDGHAARAVRRGFAVIDSFRDHYWFLSNFYPSEVELEDDLYPSVEHAFQAAKTYNQDERNAIRGAKTPAEAKKLSRLLSLPSDWNTRRVQVMRDLLRQKFSKGTVLARRLLETGDEELVEGNTWGDRFWGVCNGVGFNQLGKLLMEIREELK